VISTQITIPRPRKPSKVRIIPVVDIHHDEGAILLLRQANDDSQTVIKELKKWITRLEEDIVASRFHIENVAKNDQLITFYAGFPSYENLNACYEYLGHGVSDLQYWRSNNQDVSYGRYCC